MPDTTMVGSSPGKSYKDTPVAADQSNLENKLRISQLQYEAMRQIAEKWKTELDELREFSALEQEENAKCCTVDITTTDKIKGNQFSISSNSVLNETISSNESLEKKRLLAENKNGVDQGEYKKLKIKMLHLKLENARNKSGFEDMKSLLIDNILQKDVAGSRKGKENVLQEATNSVMIIENGLIRP
jgi:hypothetical protein